MTIKPILQFHNSDSTLDLNTTQALIIDRAIFNGGDLTLSGSSLQITVAPFVACGYDGMVAVSDASTTVTLPVNTVSYIVLHLEYRSLTTSITNMLVVSEATWTTSIHKEFFVTFAKVTVPPAVTSILASYVDYSVGDWADKLGKTGWRSPVANLAALPTVGNRDGDIRIALDTLAVYIWNAAIPASSSAWVSFTSWKAPAADFASLPATGNSLGDVRVAEDTLVAYVWDGAAWISLPLASLSLDGAYRRGVLADPSVGRIITKDGGAVETRSALASQYEDDVANAHFRANQTGDAVQGGGGFESVAYGRSGVAPASALFGFLDRRSLVMTGVSALTDTINASLLTDVITITDVGSWFMDPSSNSSLLVGYDLIEILSPTSDAGLYVLLEITNEQECRVRNLDGTAAALTTVAATIRVFRPTFGSFNPHGQDGSFNHQGVFISGVPGQESAVEVIAGSTLGRYGTLSASPDGARYALRIRWKDVDGNTTPALDIDSQGQLQSYVKNAQLTATQRTRSVNFGAPAFVVQQDQDATTPLDAEVGFIARSNAGLLQGVDQWLGVTTVGSVRDDTTAITGLFNVIEDAATAPYNVRFINTNATEAWINPTLTFVEIIGAAGYSGVYLVNSRGSILGGESGLVELVALDGTAAVFVGMGAATARILYIASLGGRNLNVGTSVIPGMPTDCRATATVQAPKNIGGGVGGAALVLDCAPNGDNAWLIRGVLDVSGATKEVFSVASYGGVYGTSLSATEGDISADLGDIITYAGGITSQLGVTAVTGDIIADAGDIKATAGDFLYTSVRNKTRVLSPADGTAEWGAGAPTWELESVGVAYGRVWVSKAPSSLLYFPVVLPDGAYLTGVSVVLNHVGGVPVTAATLQITAVHSQTGTSLGTDVAGAVISGATSAVAQLVTAFATGFETVANATSHYTIKIASSSNANNDYIYNVKITYLDPGPRNY